MGQRLCGCLARTCCPTTTIDNSNRNSLVKPALRKKDDDATKQNQQQQQQPLVVEDESWKRWSSYNLIHHQSEPQRQQSAYHPPVYVSPGTGLQQLQQNEQPHHIVPAEAVWDL